jgi:hypothetical protein
VTVSWTAKNANRPWARGSSRSQTGHSPTPRVSSAVPPSARPIAW